MTKIIRMILPMLILSIIAVVLGTIINKVSNSKSVQGENIQQVQIDNNGVGWGLKKVKGQECEVTEKQKNDLIKYDSFYMDNKRTKKIYLTFDEGYENGYTMKILDTLKEKNVPACFFVTGSYAKGEEEIMKRMVAEGHIVGNHTMNHPNLPKLGDTEKMKKEISDLNDFVEEKYNYKMKYVRPPEGEYSPLVLSVIKDMGMKCVFWSFAYKDWERNSEKGKDYAINNVVPYLHNGAVILLHAVSKDNQEALADIIDQARNLGFEFASIDEI